MPKQFRNVKSLRFEGLETRTLMAGDVTAAVVNGILEISGDNANNSIQIKQSGSAWKVQGVGTTVNGSKSAQSFTSVTGISIDLANGNDSIQVSKGTLSGDFNVNDNSGRTTVDLSSLTASNIGIITDDASDTILLNKCVAVNDIAIGSFGTDDDGRDTISLTKTNAGGEISLLGGAGDDLITLKNVNAGGAFSVDASSANIVDADVINISSASSGDFFEVLSGSGRDTVTLNKVQSGDNLYVNVFDLPTDSNGDLVTITKSSADGLLQVFTGNGADQVTITDFTAGTDIEISTAEGSNDRDDILVLTNVRAGNDIAINTGSGTDTATLNKVVAGNDLNVDMEDGKYDLLLVTRSRALAATFDGGNNNGDMLILSKNNFGTTTTDGFEFEIG